MSHPSAPPRSQVHPGAPRGAGWQVEDQGEDQGDCRQFDLIHEVCDIPTVEIYSQDIKDQFKFKNKFSFVTSRNSETETPKDC